eukprot:scaffold123447_cov19-Prasinocladus_malaysianus.AAC.1
MVASPLSVVCVAQPPPRRISTNAASASQTVVVPSPASTPESSRTRAEVQRRYPSLNLDRLDAKLLSSDPPVYLLRNVLRPEHCLAIIQGADSGSLKPVAYEQQVYFNTDRIRLLAPVLLGWGVLPAHSALSSGGTTAEAVAAGAAAVMAATGAAGLLTLVVKTAVERAIGGQVFKGKKWAANSAKGDAAAAVDRALGQVSMLLASSMYVIHVMGVGSLHLPHADLRLVLIMSPFTSNT